MTDRICPCIQSSWREVIDILKEAKDLHNALSPIPQNDKWGNPLFPIPRKALQQSDFCGTVAGVLQIVCDVMQNVKLIAFTKGYLLTYLPYEKLQLAKTKGLLVTKLSPQFQPPNEERTAQLFSRMSDSQQHA
ncbi:uncharacterized protein LOC143843933 [Paroedura picta]|uniref:uncharacterized protein LOC143843933 n=1 Tax=Paroedura picta TaxID=143630 RepID=UPI004057020D